MIVLFKMAADKSEKDEYHWMDPITSHPEARNTRERRTLHGAPLKGLAAGALLGGLSGAAIGSRGGRGFEGAIAGGGTGATAGMLGGTLLGGYLGARKVLKDREARGESFLNDEELQHKREMAKQIAGATRVNVYR